MALRRKQVVGLMLLGIVVACGGSVTTIDGDNQNSTSGSSSSSSGSTGSPTSTATTTPTTTSTVIGSRVPKQHRAVATACDNVRSNGGPFGAPDGGAPPTSCSSHAQCTQGKNGRCVGNGHDGWYCTYDICFADSDCGGGSGVCNCEGGFRSDHNVCLSTNGCHVDADCKTVSRLGGGYCSPTLGSCGHYDKAVGYHCHTAEDECIDDEDCKGDGQFGARPYCKFDQTIGHWKCSNQECAG
jgi:hypothetical protein